MTAKEPCEEDRLGRINLRPLLFCALSLFFGITLYLSIVFGKVSLPNFIFYAMFFCIALIPFSPRRMLFALSALLLFGGIGALSAHLCFSRFTSAQGGTYEIVGTVESCAVQNGYSDAVLCDLSFDGEARAGKMAVRFSSEEVGTGDIVLFEGEVETAEAEGSYGEYLFSEGIRYTASGDYRVIGKTRNVLLRLNARLHERLGAGMGKEEAQVAYALLTGNSSAMDEGLLTAVRRGGIAHIFAVSGLHIGILYAAISFLARPLGSFPFCPPPP